MQLQRSQKEESLALNEESKQCNPLTEVEQNMEHTPQKEVKQDWTETGPAHTLKPSTSTSDRVSPFPQQQQVFYSHSILR